MRHLRAGRKLGRNATHRLALYRNLALALFRHERIITTLEKAKAVRPFVEKLITLARDGSLHARRLVISRLGPMSGAEVKPAGDDAGKEKATSDPRTIVQKLFQDLGPRFKDRPGGYTRIIKRHQRRLGDGGRTAILELLREGEEKVRAKAPAAPRIEEQPAPTPETEPAAPSPEATAGTEAPPAAAASETPPAAAGETPPAPPATDKPS